MKEVEALVVSKGMTRSKIVDAIGSLGALAAAPKSPWLSHRWGNPVSSSGSRLATRRRGWLTTAAPRWHAGGSHGFQR
ncbi:MAG: hypothetical protein R3C56_18155 [Pirellulaceae bacterium]